MHHYLTYLFLSLVTNAFFTPSHAQNLLEFKAKHSYESKANDIWGYTDENSREYAIMGLENGTTIVDVTDPNNTEELFFIEGVFSVWRDIKTFNHHAYITHDYTPDTSGFGLLIIDLNNLPNSIDTLTITQIDTFEYRRAHNIFIDENGFAYLFGSNLFNGGAIILDLNNDPKAPEYAGSYSTEYIHDGFVRGDTMWTSEINAGQFAVVDVSNKLNPSILSIQETPNRFTHNCWLSDNGKVLYTTDERPGAYVTAYDVSDLSDINELDRYQSSPGFDVIPHNVFVKGKYLYISYYKDGLIVIDASDPKSLKQIGFHDTSPQFPSGDGFQGCWGVYPYLPSGNIIASDREEGLYVFTIKNEQSINDSIIAVLSPSLTFDNSKLSYNIPKDQFGEGGNISIYNVSGKLMTSNKINEPQGSFKISGTNYNSGVYFATLVFSNTFITSKFIKINGQ